MDPAWIPRWKQHHGDYFRELFPAGSEISEEDFRRFLAEAEIPETCVHIQALALPRGDGGEYATPFLRDFCLYLEIITNALLDEEKMTLVSILMENRLPFDFYLSEQAGFSSWVEDSRIRLFELFFAQGYTMQDLKGRIERKIAAFGVTDILDHFLAMETKETGHLLDYAIVHHACRYKKVDILDRLINKGYPVNVLSPTLPFSNTPSTAIYYSFEYRYDETDILDRLIMAGADVNVHAGETRSVIYAAVSLNAMRCAQRLLDVGARVRNDVDVWLYFTSYTPPRRESLEFLVQAGMDLNYRTVDGTPMEIVMKSSPPLIREQTIALIQEFGGQ